MNEFKHKLMKQNSQEKIKLHKRGKQWVALTAFSIVGLGAIGLSTTVNADEVSSTDASVAIEQPADPNTVNTDPHDDAMGVSPDNLTDADVNIDTTQDPHDDAMGVSPVEPSDEDVNIDTSNDPQDNMGVNSDEDVNIDTSHDPNDDAMIVVPEQPSDEDVNIDTSHDPNDDAMIVVPEQPSDEDVNIDTSNDPHDNMAVTPEGTTEENTNTNVNINTNTNEHEAAKDKAVEYLTNYVKENTSANNAVLKTNNVAEAQQAQSETQATLPQTGEADEAVLAGLGAASVALAGLGLAARRRYSK